MYIYFYMRYARRKIQLLSYYKRKIKTKDEKKKKKRKKEKEKRKRDDKSVGSRYYVI